MPRDELKTAKQIDSSKVESIFRKLADNTKQSAKEFNGEATFVAKEQGLDKVINKFKNLNDAVREYLDLTGGKSTIYSKVKGYYGTEEKMINNLKIAWNKYVEEVKSGKADINNLEKSDSAKAVLRYANAYDAYKTVAKQKYKDKKNENGEVILDSNGKAIQELIVQRDAVKEISEEIFEFVSQMRSIDTFKEGNYNSDINRFVQAFTPVKKIFDEIKTAKDSLGMTSEQINELLKSLNLEAYDKIESKVKDILTLGQEKRATSTTSDSMEEESEETEKAADKMEQAAKKYKEATEEIMRSSLDQKRVKKSSNEEDVWDFEAYNEKSIKKIQDKLKELHQLRDNELYFITRDNNKLANGEKTDRYGEDIESDLQKRIERYYTYSDQIEYVQKQLTEATLNFKPGDSWGEDEIGVTIKLLQDLSEQINTIKESFSTIKSPEEFQVLITSIESVSEKLRELTSSFNSAFTSFDDNGAVISITTYFESLIATIQELQKTMSQLDMSFNVKFGSTSNSKSPLEMADERRREQEAIYDQLLQERSEIEARIYGRFKSAQSPTQMIMSLFGNRKTPGLQNYPEWSAFAEEYSSQAIEAQFKKSMSGANSSLKRYIQKIVAGANLAGIDVSDIVSKYQPKDVDTGKTVSNVNELADAEDKAQKASEQMSDALSKLIKTTDLSPIIEQLETLVKQITQISESFTQLTESINNGLQISAKGTEEGLKGAVEAIKSEGEAATTATPLKEQMTEANIRLAESAENTKKSTEEAADGVKKEGDASKKGSNKEEYDDEKMKKRAKQIEDETQRKASEYEDQGVITSIEKMYDSHENLVQAIITTKKQIEEDDGRLVEQVEHYNIHWNEKGDELYSSTMTRDDYEKHNQKVAEEIAKKREQAELRRVKEERKINEQQVRLMNKAQDDKWKESEKVREKAEKEQAKKEKKQQLEQERLNSPEYRYNVAQDKIKALGEANTRVLDLKTKQLQGVDVTDQMADALDELTQKAKEAKDALDEIYKSKDIPIGKKDEINKLYNSDDIRIGDAKSRDRYRQAQSRKIDNDLNKQNAQDFKKDIDIIDQYIQKQKELNELRIQSIKTNLSSEQSDRKEALESETQAADLASEAYERLKAARDAGDMTESQLSRFKNVADSYNSIIDGSSISTKVGQNRDSLFTTIDKSLSKAYAAGDRENGGWRPEGWQDKISELKSRISDLKDEAKNIDILDPSASEDFEKLRKKILQVQTDYTNLSKSEEWKPVDTTWEDSFTNKVAKWAEQNKIAAKEFREELEKIREDAKGIDNEFDAAKLENRFSKVQTEAADRNLLGKSLGDRFKDQFKNTMTSLATYYLSFQDFIRYGREAVQTVTQLDTAMVELKKVSDESAKSYSDFMKQSFDMADQVGTTSEQIIQSTADWKRLGRSFEESKKLAQQSTVLMNVSEFENINDATEAMVSATQAYTDVASEDIIDKLNHVGNNYAVGTSQLAQGLQNAAAVLKTQGNDIDEALALLTAGNLIGQDMSKASAGIRTISLRISGTEEAKDEIAEMGEDVDDFVVRTKSKTDQIIRDYTAVASNAHQGISVLDDNGNLRDTYSILLDISKIYKEIQEEDKQYGTNRAQALVETLAGKNRSNIASSILLNGDILESVYNASKNESKGSAQHELDTYLDSIEGKTAKLQNRIQELTASAVDSEFIKAAIDGLTKILELANSLVDTFGALPTVLGAVGGILMQKNGFGMLAGKNGQGGWINLLNGLFDRKPSTKLVEQTITKPLSEAAQNAFIGLDPNSNFLQAINEKTGASLFTLRNDNTFGPMLQGMSDVEAQALKTGEAMSKMQTQVTLIPETASAAGGALSKIGSGITSIISSLGTMAVVMVASLAVQKLIESLYNLATAQKRAIEAGKEARDSISDTFDKYTEQSDSIKDLQGEYAKLSEGVSFSDGQVKNIKLSEEELTRFYEISNQLSEIAPDLVTGYDNQGNAILNLGTSVDSVNSKFEQYLDLQQRIANGDIGNQLDTAFTGIQNQVDVYTDEYEKAKDSFKEAERNLGESVDDELQQTFSSLGVITDNGTNRNYISRDTQYITVSEEEFEAMNDLLTDLQTKGASFAAWEADPNNPGVRTFTVDLSKVSTKDLLKANRISGASKATEQKNKTLSEASMNKYKMLIDKEYQEIIPAIQDYIATTPFLDGIGSDELEEQFRNGFTSIFSNMDYQSLSKDIKEAGGLQNFVDDFVTSMMATTDTRDAFKGLTELAKKQGEMAYPAIESARKEFYEVIKKAYTDEETGESLFTDQDLDLLFGYALKDENGNIVSKYAQRVGAAKQKLGLTGPAFNEWFNEADSQYADAALSEIEAMSMDKAESFAQNQEKIYKFLLPYLTGEKIKQKASSTDTLATLLNDESYKESAETASSHLSSLTGALETLRTEGQLTAEEMVNLQNSFPDLTEFTTESIQTKAFEELDEWIGKIRKGMKGMSDEGKKQTQTMIQNMVNQYGDLGLTFDDVRESYMDSLSEEAKKRGGRQVGDDFDKRVAKLQEKLGNEELDYHVLYTLIAQDEFSGTADQILAKYKDTQINWKITLDNQDLERHIEYQQGVINREASARSLKEANGEVLTPEDYKVSTTSAKSIARMRNRELDNAITVRDAINDHRSSEYAAANKKVVEAEQAALEAQIEAAQAEKEEIESATNEYQNKVTQADNAVTAAQNAIDAAEAEVGDGMADQKLYVALAEAYAVRAAANLALSGEWDKIANDVKDEHPEWYEEFIGNSLSAASSAQSDTESAKGYKNTDSQKELNRLQEDATKIQRNLTLVEQNHQKVSKSTYNALIHNAKEQIKLLKQEQKANEDNISKWREYQDQIDSLSDSIYEWSTTSESLIYDQAAQLAQTISTAMSESVSETGLTDDTINALKTAFSDLDGSRFDVSDAFYSTADGVKVNTEALQELTEAEFELIGAPLADEIANVQAQLDKNPGNSALQDKLDSLMETNAKYFAQYEEMQKALSRNAAIDLAEGTSNAGANYDENYGRVKTYKEAYEKGLTGTDDFKAWTSYLDVYGRDTLEAYEAVSGKIERYFTEDAADGLGNFLTDMEKLGYAAQDADGYWTITADDYDAAAKDMQMGSEWFMDTMNKLEDFGFIHTYVSSLNEAQLKTRDVEEQIADAVQTYSEMVARGASDEELQKQIEHINELGSSWQDLDTVTKTWGETTEANRRKEFLGLDDQLAGFEEVYKNASTDAEREAAKKAAEDYAKQFRMTLDEEDLAKGIFRLSDESAEDYASRITEFSGSMENPLTAEDMGISEENADKFETMRNGIQELVQSGDLTSLQEAVSGLNAEQLKGIDYDDKKYTEGFEAAESAIDQLREQLNLGVEDTDLLVDAMTALGLVVDQKVNLPTQFDTLDNFLATATKGSGVGYQISTDISRMSADQLQTQMSEIEQLEADINVEIDPDSDVYKQLEELKKQTEIQLNIKNSDQTQTQLKEWAETGDRENIAKTFGIDVNSEEVDKYIEQINNMPSDYDLAIHIDDSQFQTLIESITGKPYQAEVEVVGKDKLTQFVSKIRTKLQNNPITQPIVQKVQQFGQKVKEKITATVNTGDSNKQVDKVENSVEDLNKTTGTAKVNVNTKGALSNIQNVRNQLLSLNSVVATPRINVITGNATSIISQIRDSINQLRDKTVTLTTKKVTTGALGTAHALGTTALSRAHANGTQDWTVGQDESALVNEIGQESIVRDGVWQLIPGGPHVEDLRRDDIVFNAQQTADLIRTGKTARRGQLVAHANGTVPGMSAYATAGKNRGNSLKRSGGSGGGKSSGGGRGSSGGGNSNGKSGKSSSSKTSAFEKWLEKLFDWIEVRLDRIQRRIDLATAKAENAIGYGNKNANITTAMNEIAKSAADANSAQVIRNANGVVIGFTGGTADTKIGDSVRGAYRYQQQADKVAAKARKKGIFKGKEMDTIIAKIQNGTIDINEYSDKQKKFIEAYKNWYDKSQDLVQSTEELKQQYKELEQTKLDNITEQFEAWVGLLDAIKESSQALIDYYAAQGKAVNTVDRDELERQETLQQQVTDQLSKELAAYSGELANARVVFGEASNEYKNAQTKLEEVRKSLTESQKTQIELRRSILDLTGTVRGYFIERVKALVNKLGEIASLAEKRGTNTVFGYRQTEDPYMQQTQYNNELILKYYDDMLDAQNKIQEMGYEVDSEEYEKLYKQITEDESAIYSLLSTNEDLKESIRTMRWKSYEEFQKQLDHTKSDLEHINSFIRDGEILDDDAQFTERGYAQIAIIGEQMDIAEQKITSARKAMQKLDEEVANGTINQEKYNEELRAQIEVIQDASGQIFDYQQKLADMYIDQITAENDALQDLIQARRDALDAKKSYYDYDKTLKSKNKDISQLQAQINALQGVTNDAAVARRAKLEAELAEKQEDLNDTLYDHSIEIQQQGYEQLSTDIQEALDNAVKLINGDQKVLIQTAGYMLDQLTRNGVNVADTLNSIITENATAISSSTSQIIEALSADGGISAMVEKIGVTADAATALASLDIVSAINNRTPDPSVADIKSDISITKDSVGNDIAETLRNIESFVSTFTNGQTAKGEVNIGGEKAVQQAEENKAAEAAQIQKQEADNRAAEKAKLQKQYNDLKNQIDTYRQEADTRTDQIQEKKVRLNQVGRNTKKGKEILALIEAKRAKRQEYWNLIAQAEAQLAQVQTALMSFKHGTKHVSDDLLAWTNEYADKIGPEMIVRPSDGAILTPLKAGDSVIPANLADNLFKWGAISPDKFITNPFVGKWSAEGGSSVTNNADYTAAPQTVEMHFDSLFHIDGNVDESVMPRLENLGKSLVNDRDFQKNVIKFVTKDFVRESKKQGIR